VRDTNPVKTINQSYSFSICASTLGGYVSINEINYASYVEEIRYTDFLNDNYLVGIEEINFLYTNSQIQIASIDSTETSDSDNMNGNGGKALLYKAVLDSLSDYTYLDSKIFSSVISSLNKFCASRETVCLDSKKEVTSITNKDGTVDSCFELVNGNRSVKMFLLTVPDIEITFKGGLKYLWKPQSYFFRKKSNLLCLTMRELSSAEANKKSDSGNDSSGSNNILGKSFFTNHDVVYDFARNRLGIVKADCLSYIWEAEIETNNNTVSLSYLVEDESVQEVDSIKSSDMESSENMDTQNEHSSEKVSTEKTSQTGVDLIKNTEETKSNLCKSQIFEDLTSSLTYISIILIILTFLTSCAFYRFQKGENFLCISGFTKRSAGFKEVRIPNVVTGNRIAPL